MFNAMKKLIPVILVLSLIQGCMFYYKVQTIRPAYINDIRHYDSLNKYFILHVKDSAWHLTELKLTSNDLSGLISALPDNRLKYKMTKTKGGNRYKQNRESCVLEEVHIYLQDSLFTGIKAGDNIRITFSTISKLEVYNKAKGRTLVSWLTPAIVGTAIGGGILVITYLLFALIGLANG
jgi:hypothetical protein